MRRLLAAAILLVVLPGCATQERPEGIVERWLLALNQGPAGVPERYAVASVSEAVLPGWAGRAPGELDTIEVGRGVFRCEVFVACETRVPIRVGRLDGTEIRMDAIVPSRIGPPDGSRRLVVELVAADEAIRLPSEGGRPIGGAPRTSWPLAAAIGAVLAAAGDVSLRLIRGRAA